MSNYLEQQIFMDSIFISNVVEKTVKQKPLPHARSLQENYFAFLRVDQI